MDSVVLSIGSNIEPRAQYLKDCVQSIQKIANVRLVSSVYETKPLGFTAETMFFNIAVCIETELAPLELLRATKEIEQSLGRKNKSNHGVYESRSIDIDIILFGRQVIISEELIIPHPHYRHRNFVLAPLLEIAETTVDPLIQLSIREIYMHANSSDVKNDFLNIFSFNKL